MPSSGTTFRIEVYFGLTDREAKPSTSSKCEYVWLNVVIEQESLLQVAMWELTRSKRYGYNGTRKTILLGNYWYTLYENQTNWNNFSSIYIPFAR